MIKTFTAKQFHENPREVYQAAVKCAVKVTHAHHGDFYLMTDDHIEKQLDCQGYLGVRDIIGE